jgi:hypothetical protein
MGISGSKTKVDETVDRTSNETTSGTNMPVTPPWLTNAAEEYVGRIGAFGNMDPNQFVAGPAPLQQAAWQNAIPALSGWQGQARTASEMAQQAGNAPANTAGPAATYKPAQGQASTYSAPRIARTNAPQAVQAQRTTVGPAALVSGQGYQAPDLANAQGYAEARTGQPIGAQTSTVADNMGRYQNPWDQQVIDASLNQFDNSAGQQQARLAAQGAASGAFGGSRFGIAEGQLAADNTLNRASLESGLRQQGFREASQLGATDAGAFNTAGMFNAGLQGQYDLDQAGRSDMASQFGADAANRFGLAQAGLDESAGQFNANLGLQQGLANQQSRNTMGLAQFGADTDRASQFAGARNAMTAQGYQGDLQRNLAQADLQGQAGQFNAGAQNTFGLANMDARNTAGQFGADAQNQMGRFNAGQAEQAAMRGLQGAGLMGDLANQYSGNTRADLGTMAQLGDQQRGIEQQFAMAGPAQLEAMGRYSGMTPYDILVGRQMQGQSTGNMNQTGQTTTTQSPSLFNQMLGLGNLASSFI